jgi:hypothetical protein
MTPPIQIVLKLCDLLFGPFPILLFHSFGYYHAQSLPLLPLIRVSLHWHFPKLWSFSKPRLIFRVQNPDYCSDNYTMSTTKRRHIREDFGMILLRTMSLPLSESTEKDRPSTHSVDLSHGRQSADSVRSFSTMIYLRHVIYRSCSISPLWLACESLDCLSMRKKLICSICRRHSRTVSASC